MGLLKFFWNASAQISNLHDYSIQFIVMGLRILNNQSRQNEKIRSVSFEMH